MEFPTTCILCGKAFEGKRADAKYCSSTCRSRASRENSGDGSSSESSTSPMMDSTDTQTKLFSHRPETSVDGEDKGLRPMSVETSALHANDIVERIEQLEFLAESHARFQSRLTAIESNQSELLDLTNRLTRLEAEFVKSEAKSRATSPDVNAGLSRLSAKMEALETRMTPLLGLPEKLRVLERRGTEASELATRLEALEARGQVVPRLQRSLTELQSRLESGLEEARTRKTGDSTSTLRAMESRLAPIEQRLERLAAQSRMAVPQDESRLIRLEQRVERLQTRVNTSPDEDSSGRLVKLERKLTALQSRLEAQDQGSGSPLALVEALEERFDGLETNFATLQEGCVRLANWVRELHGGESADDESESSWDDEDD